MDGVVHIAGPKIEVGPYLRQRCGWCGAVLVDYNLMRVAVQVSEGEQPKQPATWPVGGLVAVDGSLSYTVEHEDGAELPANACARLDPEATV